ncbi:cytochrome P450 [Xylariaceae sp. FL1019]|nr:cytochrome P450 [Xylariaceae sp. FL1019]
MCHIFRGCVMRHSHEAQLSGPIVHANIMNMVRMWTWKSRVADGRPFKAIDDLASLTADSIFESAMGITGDDRNITRNLVRLETEDLSKFSSLDRDQVFPFPEYEAEGLLKTILVIAEVTGRFPTAPVMRLHWPINNLRPSVKNAHREKRRITQLYIDRAVQRYEREGPAAQPNTAADLIIKRDRDMAKKEGRQPRYDTDLINDSLYGYCFGGQDTTHSAMSFLVKHFGLYPRAQKLLRAHLHEAHARALSEHRCPSDEEILHTHIPYLEAFIEEVLRQNTTASAVLKETISDTVFLGHHLPKGTQLLITLWGASIDRPAFAIPEDLRSKTSQQYADDVPSDWEWCDFPADEFHPERWLREDPATGRMMYNPKAGPHMTFSAGTRECWGKRLAYLALRQVTTLLVWNFEFLPLPKGLDSRGVTDVLNAKPTVCLVRIKPLEL